MGFFRDHDGIEEDDFDDYQEAAKHLQVTAQLLIFVADDDNGLCTS